MLNHLKTLALNASVPGLCLAGLNELTGHFEGEAAEVISAWIVPTLHKVILFLHCMDVGSQSLQHSSYKQYLGVSHRFALFPTF